MTLADLRRISPFGAHLVEQGYARVQETSTSVEIIPAECLCAYWSHIYVPGIGSVPFAGPWKRERQK